MTTYVGINSQWYIRPSLSGYYVEVQPAHSILPPAIPAATPDQIALYNEFIHDYGIEDWEVVLTPVKEKRQPTNWQEEGF